MPPKIAPPSPMQLALPLEEPILPTTKKDARPREVWHTLGSATRTLVKDRWLAVMREVASDARDE